MESVPNNSPEQSASNRRSTRIVQAVPLTITGVDALGRAFQERTSTLIINCHGCRYQSTHYVLKNMWVTLKVPHPESGREPRTCRARVSWIQRPHTVRELFQVGVELEAPGNFWGIAFPPADWFPFPDAEPELAITSLPASTDAPHTPVEELSPVEQVEQYDERRSAEEPPQDNVREIRLPSNSDTSASLAQQMARLVSEAKQELDAVVRETPANAASAELPVLSDSLKSQIQEAVESSVLASSSEAAEKAVREALARADEAHEAHIHAQRERWNQELAEAVSQASKKLSEHLEFAGQDHTSRLAQQFDSRFQQAMESIENAATGIAARVKQAQNETSVMRKQAEETSNSVIREMEQRLQSSAAQARGQLAEIENATQQLHQRIETIAAAAQSGWQARLNADLSAGTERWSRQIEASLETAAQQATERLTRSSDENAMQVERKLAERTDAMGHALAEVNAAAESRLEGLRAAIVDEARRAEDTLAQIQSGNHAMQGWGEHLGQLTQAAHQDLERRAAMLVSTQSEELARHAEESIGDWSKRLQPALESAAEQTVTRLAAELEQQITSRVERAGEAVGKLEHRASAIESALRSQSEELTRASDTEIESALGRMRETMERLEHAFEGSGRAAVAKWMAEVETKTTEATHTNFESIFKTAEWYEKKTQNHMQAALEKTIEQAGVNLREKAGEISGLFATELDHYSRSFVEHTHGQVEEAARGTLDSTNNKLAELSAKAVESLAGQARQEIESTLRQLSTESGTALEHFSAQMGKETADAAEKVRAESAQLSAHVGSRLAREADQVVADARREVAAQLTQAKDDLRATAETLESQLRQATQAVSADAMNEYKERLDNASNTWLLTTVTKLSHQSEQQIESVAQATEERLRQTCNVVFAGLGDTLRSRMSEIFTKPLAKNDTTEST